MTAPLRIVDVAEERATAEALRTSILLSAIRTRAIRTWTDVAARDADRLDSMIERDEVVEENGAIWLPATIRRIANEAADHCGAAGLGHLATNVRLVPALDVDDDEQPESLVSALHEAHAGVRAAREAAIRWGAPDAEKVALRRASECVERAIWRAVKGRDEAARAAEEE